MNPPDGSVEEARLVLEALIKTLPERKQRILWDRYSGKSAHEVGIQEGCGATNIYMLERKALRFLRRHHLNAINWLKGNVTEINDEIVSRMAFGYETEFEKKAKKLHKAEELRIKRKKDKRIAALMFDHWIAQDCVWRWENDVHWERMPARYILSAIKFYNRINITYERFHGWYGYSKCHNGWETRIWVKERRLLFSSSEEKWKKFFKKNHTIWDGYVLFAIAQNFTWRRHGFSLIKKMQHLFEYSGIPIRHGRVSKKFKAT